MRPQIITLALIVVIVIGSASFVVDVKREEPRPVPFEGTNEGGLAYGAVYEASQTPAAIPRAEVYYSQYQYVAGYYGISFLINDLHEPGHTREFGRLLTVYVSDFTDTGVKLRSNSTLSVPPPNAAGWVAAENAYFVVESRAQTPGETQAIVPFSTRQSAHNFTQKYGGSVIRWNSLRNRQFDSVDRTRDEWEQTVTMRQTWANQTATRRQTLLDRPVETVVGTDAPTVAAAIEQAPPNTTVRVPPGSYNVTTLTISKPLTVRGAGPNSTTITGDGNGHVFSVTSDQAAIAGLRIAGIGTNGSAARPIVTNGTFAKIWKSYGRGAAGIAFTRASDSLVANVTIATNQTGLLIRESPRTVVTDTSIYGPPEADDGSIGISVMSSRILVQDSAIYGGFHSFIIHDTSGIVVRDIHAEGAVTGFHGLYLQQGLVANSTFRDMFKPVMTATEGSANAAIGNDVRNAALGIDFAGSRNYIARNTVIHNRAGILVEGRRSVYTENVVGYNRIGFQVANPFPTNRITRNDFVGNVRHVKITDENTRYVWTEDNRGNYWGGYTRFDSDDNGLLDQPIRPTSTSGRMSYQTPGGDTLVRSPAVAMLRALQTVVPGLRSSGVIDTAPLASPVSPQETAQLADEYSYAEQYRPATDTDPYDYHTSDRTYG
ncbi:NosD domain-containing protein [Haloarcula amylovorans]|uniref:NosD domain-containing protein n=1 Tax=Haloarcula amylovorans TaxID=2562280 RepID=UPI0010762659|nr:NosD domain-containing protein [Halomicroarcula amylolytica]